MSEFRTAYAEAEDRDAKSKVLADMYPDKGDFADDVFAIVEENPKSELSAKALSWLITGIRDQDISNKATDMMLEHHIQSPEIAGVASSIMRSGPSQKTEDVLVKIIDQNPDLDTQGKTAYSLLQYYMQLDRFVSNKEQSLDSYCLLYTSPSPRDRTRSRMPSSA